MKKRRLNRLNLSIAIIVPILFGGIMVAVWGLGLGISTVASIPRNVFLTWLVGVAGVIVLVLIYLLLRWLCEVICTGIGMLIDFIYAEEEK